MRELVDELVIHQLNVRAGEGRADVVHEKRIVAHHRGPEVRAGREDRF